jgi:hypothetical protein
VDGKCSSGMGARWMGDVVMGWTEEGADGRYPSLLMRALGLRLVPSSPHLAKLVSYEYMNRQLVWNAFTVSPPSHSSP